MNTLLKYKVVHSLYANSKLSLFRLSKCINNKSFLLNEQYHLKSGLIQFQLFHQCHYKYPYLKFTVTEARKTIKELNLKNFLYLGVPAKLLKNHIKYTFFQTNLSTNTKFNKEDIEDLTEIEMGKNKKSNVNKNAAYSKPNYQSKKNKSVALGKVPTRINLVVIGTGGPGTSHSLLLTTEYRRYMFNCGEGAQRLGAISKGLRRAAFARVAGLENIFITHKSWENMGGILGMAMTLEGQKNPDAKAISARDFKHTGSSNAALPKMTIYGPPNVEKIALLAKKFAVASNMNIEKGEGIYEDNCVAIKPVSFCKMVPNFDKPEDEFQTAKRQKKDADCKKKVEACFYIVQAKPPLPKINVEKCFNAGITMGPMVGLLQKGQSVTLEDGTIVHPEQVTDIPIMDNRPFMILECPDLDFFSSLASCPELQEFTTDSKEKKSFSIIVHMTPQHVFESEVYQTWLKSFHISTDHLLMNRSAVEADPIRIREHQARLNLVSEELFPMLPAAPTSESVHLAAIGTDESMSDLNDNDIDVMTPETERMLQQKKGQTAVACTGLVYVSRGKQLGFHIEVDDFKCQELQEQYLSKEGFKDELEKFKNSVAENSRTEDNDSDEDSCKKYPRVVFLGTGSSEPNKIRSQSCIVVQLRRNLAMMLDCGEDSYGQLHRFYGSSQANKILRNLKAIFISHLHGDHHLGLISLLKERKNAFDSKGKSFTPILLIAPVQMKRYLKFYHTEIENITSLFRFVKIQTWLTEYDDGITLQTASFEDVLQELKLSEFNPVSVEHCNNAFGVCLKKESGFKLVYSGDTMPCDALIQAGENCDLLIHEATHEDSLSAHAKASKHSTFSQAIDVGKKMEAKNIILTHFSQRYCHMVPLHDIDLPENVGIAFDNMQVCPQTMKILPKTIPVLTQLFSVELEKTTLRTFKRSKDCNETVDHN